MTDTTNRPAWWGSTERAAATAEVDSEVLWKAHGETPPPLAEGDWNHLAQTHPELQLNNPDDPAQRNAAYAYRLRATAEVMHDELDREPGPVDQYLAVKHGPLIAPDIAKAPANAPLSGLVPQDHLTANAKEFEGVTTAGEYRARTAEKMGVTGWVDPSPAVAPPPPPEEHPRVAPVDADTPAFLLKRLAGGHDASHINLMKPQLQQGIRAMIEAAPPEIAAGLGIGSGTRTIERQTELWNDALKKYGSADEARKWVAPPGHSQHNFGQAADLSFNGKRLDQAPPEVVKWVHDNAAQFGLTFPLGNEAWHVEPIGARGGKGAPVTVAGKTPWLSADHAAAFKTLEESAGLPANAIAIGAHIESRGNPNLQPKGNSNVGLLGFAPKDMVEYGQHNPLDPMQAAAAYAEEGRRNTAWLKGALGRDPDAGDIYFAHQQGSGGAKALLQNPDMPAWRALLPSYGGDEALAKKAIKGNLPSDHPMSKADLDKITARDFYQMWHDRALGISVAPSDNAAWTKPSSTVSNWEANEQAYNRRKEQYGVAGAAWETVKHESPIGWMYEGMRTPLPDRNWLVTDKTLRSDDRLANVPADYQRGLLDTTSRADYERKLALIQDQMNYERKLGELGGTGVALRMFGAAVDPAGWLLSSVSPLAAGAKAGKLARIFTSGANMAMGTAAAELPQALENPVYEKHQLFTAAAGGFLFGAAVGHFAHAHPDVQAAVDQIIPHQESLLGEVADAPIKVGQSSTSAAEALHHVEDVRTDVADWTHQSAKDALLGKATFAKARFDATGSLMASENPVFAALGRLGEDGVGSKDYSASAHAVSVEQKMIAHRYQTMLAASFDAHFSDYAQRNGWGPIQRVKERKGFSEKVADFIENPDRAVADAADPSVKGFADECVKVLGEYHALGQNPGMLDGTIRKPIPGLAGVPKNEMYFPHIYDFDKFREFVGRFGDKQMTELLTKSIRSHMPDLVPEEMEGFIKARKAFEDAEKAKNTAGMAEHAKTMDDIRAFGAKLATDDLAGKLAKRVYAGLRHAQVGDEVHLSRILSGSDVEGLRTYLSGMTEMSKGEIDYILNALKPQEGAEGPLGRLKRRTPMNPLFAAKLLDKDGNLVPVSVKQFMNRDAYEVMSSYNRQLSAQVALGRLRVENPAWTEGSSLPRFLIDGVHNDSQWADLMSQAKAVGDALGHDRAVTEKDIETAQFLYDSIRGTLNKADRGKLGSFLRIIRDWNFTRVMNQVGFAQVAETWRLVSEVGIKAAMSNMPAYREFVRSARTGQLTEQSARELEWICSPGTDMLRSKMFMTTDDFGNHVGADGWKSAETGMKMLAHTTSLISGMGPLTAYQQKWAAKAAVARFVWDAEGKMPMNMKRLALLGVDNEMAGKIRQQILKHRGAFLDEETGRSMPTLNLDKWDAGARHAFEYAIHSWTARMIHENDVGQLTAVLGSQWGKLMAQFRMFTIGSYTKNSLNALHMRDGVAASNVLGSTAMAGLLYVAQTYLQSIGRSDQGKFLDKKLGTKEIAAASFQRAGYSSIAPQFIDLFTFALGLDPLMDSRVSGTPSSGLVSNPTVSLFDNGMQAIHGLTDAATGGVYSQKDARAALSTLPFSNFLPVLWGANAMMAGLPEKEPPKPRH